jgi:hypothetical protein
MRLLAATLLILAMLPFSAAASSGQAMTFEAPSELLDDHRRDATLDEIRSFGVERVRALVYWSHFAPAAKSRTRPAGFDAANPASYDFGRLDRLVDAAHARGMDVQMTLTGPVPRWATKLKVDQVLYPSAREFEKFAYAVGARYRDRVSMWSIWNEPNHPQFLGPQYRKGRAFSPHLYRSLYKHGRRGIVASGNGADTILFGETAPRGTARVVAPLEFLRGALCLDGAYRRSRRCGRLAVDGYAHHAYTTRSGPGFVPPDRDDVTIGVLGRLTRALDRAARAGAVPRRLGVYLTEFGIQSKPDPYVGVSLRRQAEYLAQAERTAFFNRRVKSFSQYLLHDDQPRPGPPSARYSGFESGLRRSDGRAKPAYEGFRLPLAATRRGRSVQLWGLTRPSRARGSVRILYGKGGRWRVLEDVPTGARGAFTARTRHVRGRSYRVSWNGHTGPPVRPY